MLICSSGHECKGNLQCSLTDKAVVRFIKSVSFRQQRQDNLLAEGQFSILGIFWVTAQEKAFHCCLHE